jgi:hypothetical protein
VTADRRYLSPSCIARHVPAMRAQGVSTVARSPRGFLTAWKRAGGDLRRLPSAWRRKRAAFIARHDAQRRRGREPLRDRAGRPTRRHLAFIAWAWSPERGCPR